VSLQPDVIKLDISLTRNIDTHERRRALAAAFVGFARETGCRLVPEGVETETELAALRELGAHQVQGYFIGRPVPLDEALRGLGATG
jgi:EAL domain-containing protein (putative c-di-GMP-specific phosphodiesterase class I)